ncbi:hypothetical protein CEXT_231801 [Caerostris extrusa]|uniref:C2H2-type domain-containing protein n=1 Tax=Caerostris extrusa TaxID=172846 RepID=A0AAV4SCX4_CAEEX|nr:hypothetical protein CEXT_231801 [Caerostris extrusa]
MYSENGCKTFCCSRCTYSTPDTGHIQVHLAVHDFKEGTMFSVKHNDFGIKLFCCLKCTYATPHKGDLKVHIMTHINIRPYVCSVCQNLLKSKDISKKHSRLHLE